MRKHLSSRCFSNICELFPEGTCEESLHNVSEICQEDIHQHSIYANVAEKRRVFFNGFDRFTV